jgi:outer membrane protein TolC
LVSLSLGGLLSLHYGAEGADSTRTIDLSLTELQRLVLGWNDANQMKMLEAAVSRKVYQGERGIFEPVVVGSIDHVDTERPNTRQQSVSLGYLPFYIEQNTLYNAGLEFLLPTGAKLRTGYTLRDLNNNVGAPYTNYAKLMGAQFETFVGASLTQPLLKNFGYGVTTAKIRLAAIGSEIAFQEYRRQLMLTLANAEAGYWELHLLQEQARFGEDSVATASKILADNRARVDLGKSPALEVLQAEAGLAFRRTRLNEAQQKVYEGGTRLGSLYAYTPGRSGPLPRAVDHPDNVDDAMTIQTSYQQAFGSNPDYLIRRSQLEQEHVRLAYTKNQLLPELDLKATYGLNGLGPTVGGSWDGMWGSDYPAWSVGAELRIPITGGIKERNDYAAARLSTIRALTGMKDAEVQILNGVDAAQRKVQLYKESVTNYQAVADFHVQLLQAQMDRLAVGSTDSRTVLETEEKMFEAKVAVVESLVSYRKALLELEFVRGSLLEARAAEVTREALKAQTEMHLKQSQVAWEAVERFKREAVTDIDRAARLQN